MSEHNSEPPLFSLPPSTNNPGSEEQTTEMTQHVSFSTQKELPTAPDDPDKIFHKFHQHNLSDSTTGSYDSSPTTTISTVDDSSATDPSPESSPESPPPSTFTAGMLRPRTADDAGAPFFELQKQPPPRKGRNLKNLAVNTSRPNPRAASTTSLPIVASDVNQLSTITSPTFVKPPSPTAKKRLKSLGLTLLTPGPGKVPPQEVKLSIPPTPALIRPALRHFQSSPSLPAFPVIGRPAGIRPHGPHVPVTLETITSPVEESNKAALEEDQQNFDIPLSREIKPEAYPDGPICVYEPYIDLYLEPTAEQCRQYDVIMNVASEVLNPLVEHKELAPEEPEIRIDGGGGIQYAPKRPHLTSLQENGDSNQTDSPTTPKATSLNSTFPPPTTSDESSKEPEYIHIKWEHNSDIVPDLLRLVKLIDDRVRDKKRVLVHCQCGVSRSASLVVAYGLYKNPSASVQEAYDAVKQRSKWIGPNMNLIMQLQEFRTSLTRGGLLVANRNFSPITPSSAFAEWRGPFSANPSDHAPRIAPMSAGIPTSNHITVNAEPMQAITPGPSSAPSDLAWPADTSIPPLPAFRARASSAANPAIVEPAAAAYVDPSGHLVPVLKVVEPERHEIKETTLHVNERHDAAAPTESVASPRSAEFAMTPLHPAKEVAPDDSFGLMSPSSTEFSSSPFDRSALLASLGMGSIGQQDESPATPRRSQSLRSRERAAESGSNLNTLQQPKQGLGLRKISSPNLREQKELQAMQARIEATLPFRSFQDIAPNEALMSPRAEEFTKNPFALALSIPATQTQDNAQTATIADPRSPAQTGVNPITRNIMDFL